MNATINAISNRLSLRQPQRDSLEILARVCDIISLEKGADPAAALEAIKAEFPSVTDFERDFPSLCFALATGVGKTRLMGAFISYLYRAENIRHYFVLAPNLTIYNKLIADFTPNTPNTFFRASRNSLSIRRKLSPATTTNPAGACGVTISSTPAMCTSISSIFPKSTAKCAVTGHRGSNA